MDKKKIILSIIIIILLIFLIFLGYLLINKLIIKTNFENQIVGFANKNYPLVTMISRFDPQKGLDLIYSAFFEICFIKTRKCIIPYKYCKITVRISVLPFQCENL